ncbi:MAG TPA: ATP-binding protein [Micavibrio sp.]|nr:ATP-binding protein [Micavibrio sp.]
MKNPALVRNFFIFMLILGACLGGLAYNTMRSAEKIRATDVWANHTQKVIMETQKLTMLVTNVISVHRNLVILKKEGAQAGYDDAKAKMSNHIAMLRELTKDNAAQNSRMNEIEHLSLKLKDALDQKTRVFGEDILPAPLMMDYDDVVKIRDDIFRLAGDMLDSEYKLLGLRERVVQVTVNRYQASLLIGGLVSTLIILIFNWYLLQAQSKVSTAEANLRDSEERLRLAIRGSNDGIFDWNFKTHQIYWSPQYKAMLGYDDSEIRGEEETFRRLLHPEDSESFWENFNNYINGNLSEFSCVFRMIHKSGRQVWIHGRGKALFDENGQPQRFIGAHTDISYIKEHERLIREERDRAEKASQAKGEFLAHMSHEIRTPLTAVSGIAEIFSQSKNFADGAQKKLVETLKTSTESLKELITDILDFSKIESGEIELHHQKFSLPELFDQVISMMSVKAGEKFLDFTFDYSGIEGTIFNGDKQRIRQILINLIGNAIKFTEKGYVTVRARIEPVGDAHILRINIQDSGIGIPEASLPHIFEKFRQADASVSRRYGGTGLGLPISKSLAEIMGGTIRAESEVGRGSTFSLVLPFTSTIADPEVDMGEVIRLQKLNDRLRAVIGEKNKILLVEDYEGNIVVLSYILNALDCEFDVAKTGLEALQLWKGHHYDLILMDIQMPEMDGLTATRTIRKMEEEQSLARTPVIGLTAHALVADKQKCIDAGMDDYLSKPIIEADLKAAILRMLEKQPGSGENQAA